MSTILKSAAMSLLSKTLQAFLSKYLSDVDVEGVAIPSMYDGSGWGVRLSNVKLRDGVQLMEKMPGRQIRKHKRIHKKKKTKPPPSSTTSTTTEPLTTDEPHDQQSLRSVGRNVGGLYGGNKEAELDLSQDELQYRHPGDEIDQRASRTRVNSYEELDLSVSDDQLGGSRPTTPVQDSKSIFSCFTKGKKNRSNATRTIDTIDSAYDEEESMTEVPSSIVDETQIYRQSSRVTANETRGENSVDSFASVTSNNDAVEESDSEDEFEDYEQSYRLCVGDSGRIGTLDIRLVDKELHVLVEDAVLTIECYPVPESFPETSLRGGDASLSGTEQAHSAAAANTGSQPNPVPPGSKAKTKAEPKRDTVGDRVLADNPLARAIAAIPHLFLRDVRICLVLRNEPLKPKSGHFHESSSAFEGVPVSSQPGPEDTMVEIGIEFLAVNNGEDALSAFQQTQEDSRPNTVNSDGVPSKASLKPSLSSSNIDTSIDNNEYMVRHIRTGRGSDAGIWVQVFAPTPKLPARAITPTIDSPLWARQRWIHATNFHLLRCSGLDVRARIYLGTRKQVSSYSWFFDYEEEYEEYDYEDPGIDSMMVGFDSIAPGMPSLPPMNPSMHRGDSPYRSLRPGETIDTAKEIDAPPAMYPGSEKFTLDDNDIQSCKIPSSFHRISRGLRPGSYREGPHAPSESAELCWDGPQSIPLRTSLDSSLPLPGLVLQITIRDPLEINLDRPSIETLNLLKTLFAKKRDSSSPSLETATETVPKDTKAMARLDSTSSMASSKSTATRSGFFSFFSSTKDETEKQKDPLESFSSIMQPENIQVLGVHLAKIVFRAHFLRDDRLDDGVSFAYWDMLASCLNIDLQSLNSQQVVSQDLRVDIGHFAWKEFCGVEQKQVAELGVRLDSRTATLPSTSQSLNEDHLRNRTPWPSAACALMDIPPPQETIMYKGRRDLGVQLQLISATNAHETTCISRKMLTARIGAATLAAPWGFWRDLLDLKKNIVSGIVGKATVPATPLQVTAKPAPTMMAYDVQIDGVAITMPPMIDVKAPATRLVGELSSEAGIFFSTVLSDLQLAYGRKARSNRRGLSIQQLATLPDNVRTRILFCLDNWNALEDALGVKARELKNPFKRTMAINKAITQASTTRVGQVPGDISKKKVISREEILASMMKLSDEELNKLWLAHQGSR